jgi:hypothetical protein
MSKAGLLTIFLVLETEFAGIDERKGNAYNHYNDSQFVLDSAKYCDSVSN